MKLSEYQQHLGTKGRKLFADWRKKYGLSKEKELFLLGIVAESHETIIRSRQIINKEESTIEGLHGKKQHPEIGIMKDAKNKALAAIKELGLFNIWQFKLNS